MGSDSGIGRADLRAAAAGDLTRNGHGAGEADRSNGPNGGGGGGYDPDAAADALIPVSSHAISAVACD